MLKHISKGLIVCLLVIFLMPITAAPVMAADLRSGETITVASGEIIDDDLYVAGSDIVIDGIIDGDLWAVGSEITINGTVNGSVIAVGQTITVNGEIAHAARLAGETLSINGNIKGDLLAFGGNVNIAGTAKIGGDFLVGARSSRIDGAIAGDIKGGAGEISITNGVGGDVELEVDQLTIASTATVQGNLTYTSDNEADIQSGAQVKGVTTHNIPEAEEPAKKGIFAGLVSALTGKILAFLMILVIGIIIILVTVRKPISMSDSIRNNTWQTLGWGALILFVTPIAAIIVCFTVVGIPIALIALALWGIALYLSQIPVALCIGRLIIRRSREVESRGLQIGALAAGLAILAVLRLIPFLGFFIWLATALFGLGSLVTSVRRLRVEI